MKLQFLALSLGFGVLVLAAQQAFASCALPGIFPPREIGGRTYVDGAVVENLPVRLAEIASADPILAINLTEVSTARLPQETAGFAATYIRGLEIVMQTQSQTSLEHWDGPPLLLVQPRVAHVSMFSFTPTDDLIGEGRRATLEAIDALSAPLHDLPDGLYPRRRVRLRVSAAKCIGCQLCALSAPEVFRMVGDKAEVTQPEREWSPLDGRYVHECPTAAIEFDEITEAAQRKVG